MGSRVSIGGRNYSISSISSAELLKSAETWLTKSIFYVKNYLNLSLFFWSTLFEIAKLKAFYFIKTIPNF